MMRVIKIKQSVSYEDLSLIIKTNKAAPHLTSSTEKGCILQHKSTFLSPAKLVLIDGSSRVEFMVCVTVFNWVGFSIRNITNN